MHVSSDAFVASSRITGVTYTSEHFHRTKRERTRLITAPNKSNGDNLHSTPTKENAAKKHIGKSYRNISNELGTFEPNKRRRLDAEKTRYALARSAVSQYEKFYHRWIIYDPYSTLMYNIRVCTRKPL